MLNNLKRKEYLLRYAIKSSLTQIHLSQLHDYSFEEEYGCLHVIHSFKIRESKNIIVKLKFLLL